jgi:hypothetical protein
MQGSKDAEDSKDYCRVSEKPFLSTTKDMITKSYLKEAPELFLLLCNKFMGVSGPEELGEEGREWCKQAQESVALALPTAWYR